MKLLNRAKKLRYMKTMLIVGNITMTVYVVVSLLLAWLAGEQPADALTYAVFGYWGIEGGWSALIKITESKQKDKTEQPPEDRPGA